MRPSSPTEAGPSVPAAGEPVTPAPGRLRWSLLRRAARQWVVSEVLGDLLKSVLSQGLDWLGRLLP